MYQCYVCWWCNEITTSIPQTRTRLSVLQAELTINNEKYIANLHCKKRLLIFPPPARTSLTKLSLASNNFINSRPGRVWLVTSRLGTGKLLTFFTLYVFDIGVQGSLLPALAPWLWQRYAAPSRPHPRGRPQAPQAGVVQPIFQFLFIVWTKHIR